MKTIIITPINLYLDCRVDRDSLVAKIIASKLEEIIKINGTNLSFKISKIKHIDYGDDYTIINGFVRCHLPSDDDEYFHTPSEVREYLEENWYDYVIEYEVLL